MWFQRDGAASGREDALQAFDRFFTSSEYNRREILRFMRQFIGAEKPIEKCLFGQNINSQGAAATPLPHGLSQGQYLLSVGRVTAYKNQLRLLQAWAQVIAAGQHVGDDGDSRGAKHGGKLFSLLPQVRKVLFAVSNQKRRRTRLDVLDRRSGEFRLVFRRSQKTRPH